MLPRKALYFTAGVDHTVSLSVLKESGWEVFRADSLQQALDLQAEHRFAVGIMLFESADTWRPVEIEEMFLSASPLEWIALVPAACLQCPETCHFLLERFYDYHRLPVDIDRLRVTLGHVYGMVAMRNEHARSEGRYGEYEMVGESPSMLSLFRTIDKVAGVDAPLLITGESGTGKELAAVAVHKRSRRKDAPFIAVNSGALPANLIQAELFGYEKGAFTGAGQRKKGRFELAEKGTLFLDEIGDLSLELQINLLRFLQERTIERVGGQRSIELDVRIVAATHVDLEQAVEEGRFREDLYYRLNVLRTHVPPLRERDRDIELLAQFFFRKFKSEGRRSIKGFHGASLRTLNAYAWPGNVRELVNRVRRAVVMCENHLITPGDLGLERRQRRSRLPTLAEARADAERDAISKVLRASGGNVSYAARQLDVSRVTLYRLMEKHGVAS